MDDRIKKRLINIIQWGLTGVAVWYVAHDVSWDETVMHLANVDLIILLAVLGITILEFVPRFSLWWVLLNSFRMTPLSITIRIDLVIKFINHVIPSKASGHTIAPLIVKHYTDIEWVDAVTISGLNTGLYATLYGFTSLCGLLLLSSRLPNGITSLILLSSVMYVVVGVLIIFIGTRLDLAVMLLTKIQAIIEKAPRIGMILSEYLSNILSFTNKSTALFRDVLSRPTIIFPYIAAWVGMLAVFPGVRVAVLLGGLGGSFTPLWVLPIALVMAYSVTVLPLTPGGIGVTEASATIVLVSLGISQELAIVVVIVDRVLGVYLPSLLGAIPTADLDLTTIVSDKNK
jgi:uncharacterized protein (TIRG00374 family)